MAKNKRIYPVRRSNFSIFDGTNLLNRSINKNFLLCSHIFVEYFIVKLKFRSVIARDFGVIFNISFLKSTSGFFYKLKVLCFWNFKRARIMQNFHCELSMFNYDVLNQKSVCENQDPRNSRSEKIINGFDDEK